MATYKVIQDIEAEDKLVGPLTLRQFVYAGIVAILGFVAFKLAVAKWFLAIPFVPPILFFGMLAAPFGHDQSNEVWLLAKIRFMLKPRRRIWDQAGLKELVTINVPKKIERHLTNGLDQDEVRSRLSALANTIDSRGWAVKNVNVNLFSQPSYILNQQGSDRLIDPLSVPQEVPSFDTAGLQDILDERSSSTAQHLDQMMHASAQAHHDQVVAQMQGQAPAAQPANYWFMNQPDPGSVPAGYATFDDNAVVAPHQPTPAASNKPTEEEAALLNRIHEEQGKESQAYGHLRTLQPLSAQHQTKPASDQKPTGQPAPATTTAVNPAILELAHNDDLNVATLARQANKQQKGTADGEVVISLR